MQQEDDEIQEKAGTDDGRRPSGTGRRRSGRGLDSIVSGLREQEDRRKRSTPSDPGESESR